ncbi:hypothetical protein DFJ58DRAFT_749813 [Suillus subalutaceus]|uniref:uncharacterized protein n=1 Tax=Suillus subalutaceus TaxID=48586 RepID=UPI001B8825C1|nr:uncharacterized protein DFJ58DRAFT_749813 [Suillus subalutaceus]KAG1836354.1 hypothetical protein DFJ58DRAFT_749813 [Suillus subalutaceus]
MAFTIAEEIATAAGAIIPAITYQLALAFPRIRGEVVMAVESDEMLLFPGKYCRDQSKGDALHIFDAPDECFSSEEAARLVMPLADMFAGPYLLNTHLIFTTMISEFPCKPVSTKIFPPPMIETPYRMSKRIRGLSDIAAAHTDKASKQAEESWKAHLKVRQYSVGERERDHIMSAYLTLCSSIIDTDVTVHITTTEVTTSQID